MNVIDHLEETYNKAKASGIAPDKNGYYWAATTETLADKMWVEIKRLYPGALPDVNWRVNARRTTVMKTSKGYFIEAFRYGKVKVLVPAPLSQLAPISKSAYNDTSVVSDDPSSPVEGVISGPDSE